MHSLHRWWNRGPRVPGAGGPRRAQAAVGRAGPLDRFDPRDRAAARRTARGGVRRHSRRQVAPLSLAAQPRRPREDRNRAAGGAVRAAEGETARAVLQGRLRERAAGACGPAPGYTGADPRVGPGPGPGHTDQFPLRRAGPGVVCRERRLSPRAHPPEGPAHGKPGQGGGARRQRQGGETAGGL